MPFDPFLGEGSTTQIDCRQIVGILILTSLLEDLALPGHRGSGGGRGAQYRRLPLPGREPQAASHPLVDPGGPERSDRKAKAFAVGVQKNGRAQRVCFFGANCAPFQ